MTPCDPDDAAMVVCLRGTLGCRVDHAEPTLLDRLDQAEADLAAAQGALDGSYEYGAGSVIVRAQVNVNAAAARCMAAAARCLVSVEGT